MITKTVKVLVFGANGLLGRSLCPYLRLEGYQVFTAGRSEDLDYTLDLLNVSSVKKIFDDLRPDHAINLIAATNVDNCEIDVAMATTANALIPAAISTAVVSSLCNIHLVHVSTDQVYEGTGNHFEEDVGPINVYGLSKLAGELLISHKRTAVLRTNFYGRSKLLARPSFSDWVVRSLEARKSITLFNDVRFSAIHLNSLCLIIQKVLMSQLSGTFNVGCYNGVSKAEFALALAQKLGLPTSTAKVGTTADASFKARRPLDMTLNIKMLENALGIKCPDIYEEIIKTANEYSNA